LPRSPRYEALRAPNPPTEGSEKGGTIRMEPASASASASVPERPPPRRSNCGAGVSPAHLGGSSWKPAAVSLRSASSAASRVPSESELSSVPRAGNLARCARRRALVTGFSPRSVFRKQLIRMCFRFSTLFPAPAPHPPTLGNPGALRDRVSEGREFF
jgi:hypothetical protein